MKQIKDDINQIDVDKAWENLYARLENEQLIPCENDNSSYRKQMIPLKWISVAAVVCIGLIFTVFYLSKNKDNSQVFMQNKENAGTLVATLDDGSTVYLENDASISYPKTFANNQRKIELKGDALFCVTKDNKRPFIVETNGITIEVTGTIFAIKSSPGIPFELSVKQGTINIRLNDDDTALPVEAGETVHLNENKLIKSEINNNQVFSTFTDKMCFKAEKLNNIIHAINTFYGSPFISADESLYNRTLTVTFENNSIETMAELICQALNLEKINKQDTIFIRQFVTTGK